MELLGFSIALQDSLGLFRISRILQAFQGSQDSLDSLHALDFSDSEVFQALWGVRNSEIFLGSPGFSRFSGLLSLSIVLRVFRGSSCFSGIGISLQVLIVNGRNIVSCSAVNHQPPD